MTRGRALAFATALAVAGVAQAQPAPQQGAAPDAGVTPPATTHVLRPPPDDARPEIESTIDPREGLETGDVVTWTLRIRSREADDVTVVRLDEANGEAHGDSLGRIDDPVHLLDQSVETNEVTGGRVARVFSVRYLLLAPGEHELPRVAVRVLTADGQLGFVEPEAPRVSVGSVIGNEPNADLKPPTDPVAVMEEDPRPMYVLAALAAMLVGALLAFFAARWWKRRAMRPAPPPPPRPAWEVAVEKLDALRRTRPELVQQGRAGEWADGVSDVLREYLGSRYGFEGLESTTDEVIERLRETHLGGITVTEIAALLGESDLVKFAKAPLDDRTAESLLDGSYRVVRATTPVASAPTAAPSQTSGGAT